MFLSVPPTGPLVSVPRLQAGLAQSDRQKISAPPLSPPHWEGRFEGFERFEKVGGWPCRGGEL